MLRKEVNDLLTQTDSGTPMGFLCCRAAAVRSAICSRSHCETLPNTFKTRRPVALDVSMWSATDRSRYLPK